MVRKDEFGTKVRNIYRIIHGFINISKLKIEVRTSYKELYDFIKKFNNHELLASITLVFGSSGVDEESMLKFYASPWLAWTEIITGIVMKEKDSDNKLLCPSFEDLNRIRDLMTVYWKNIQLYELYSTNNDPSLSSRKKEILFHSKLISMSVRRDAYIFNYWNSATELYSSHKQWFEEHLGFNIENAVSIGRYIFDYLNQQCNILLSEVDYSVEKVDLKKAYSSISFTTDDIVKATGIDLKKSEAFFNRMSLSLECLGVNYRDSFANPFKIPWDFNPLYDKPVIRFRNRYLVVSPSLMAESIFKTFYYDLMEDKEYSGKFSNERGKWLEEKTAKILQKVFPVNEIFLNPLKMNNEELCDILVLHDHKALIINCKSKLLTLRARIGEDIKKIKEDFIKGVINSFLQAGKAKEYLQTTSTASFLYKNLRITLNSAQVSDYFLICITSENYNNLLTQLKLIEQGLQVFGGKEFPWAVSINDLDVILEILDKPYTFVHYLKNRLTIEYLKQDIIGYELDLLGYYIQGNLFFNSPEFRKATGILIDGYSAGIDSYILSKYFGLSARKPAQKWPEHFEKLITQTEELGQDYRTDCILKLLDLDNETKNIILNTLIEADSKLHRTEKPYIYSLLFNEDIENESFGISVFIAPRNKLVRDLYEDIYVDSILRKYTTKSKEWICIAKNTGSERIVDTVFYANFKWKEDPVIEKMCKEELSEEFLNRCKEFYTD